MKQSLVAAAALAFVSAASAQSSVTIYGRLDASIGTQKTSNAGFVAGATTDVGLQIRSGAHNGARWGLRGTEDLGGGLKADFVLEQGFSIDTSAFLGAGNQFHRNAYVGLSGGFGAITLGRQYQPIDTGFGRHDAMGYSGMGAMNFVFNANCTALGPIAAGAGDCVVRLNNSIRYTLPKIGGLDGYVTYAPGENKAAGVSAGSAWGTFLHYTSGPFEVGGAWQRAKATGAALATTDWELGGSYNFGVANLFLQFEGGTNRTTTVKDNGWNLGLTAPIGPIKLSAAYARENQKLAGASLATTDGFSIMARYDLSKRTYLYSAYLNGERDPAAAALPSLKQRNFSVGLVHDF